MFDFTDGSRWKAMSEEAVRSVCAPGSTSSLPLTPPLCSTSVVPNEASNQLELEMRYLLAEHRKVANNLPPKSNVCKVHFGIQLKGTFTPKMNHPLVACQSKMTKKLQKSIVKVVLVSFIQCLLKLLFKSLEFFYIIIFERSLLSTPSLHSFDQKTVKRV